MTKRHETITVGVTGLALVAGAFMINAFLSSDTVPGDYPSAAHSKFPSPEQQISSRVAYDKPRLHPLIATSASPELKKLAEYEAVYGPIANELMLFTDTPRTVEQAQMHAARLAPILHEMADHKVRPLVILEPMAIDQNLDFKQYSQGAYDESLRGLFLALKTHGITDAAMGTWIVFPEANAPEWGDVSLPESYDTTPTTFVTNVTRTVQLQKEIFPQSKSGLLLNSLSYPSGDIEWAHGEYKSLVPYVTGIPKGLIDTIGLQGFPWSAPANQPAEVSYDPKTYLNGSLLKEVADYLQIRQLWFNTGSFATMYANDPAGRIETTPEARAETLKSVLAVAGQLQTGGYDVQVNIFAADKSALAEGIDWSYGSQASRAVFRDFLQAADQQNTPISLFDTTER